MATSNLYCISSLFISIIIRTFPRPPFKRPKQDWLWVVGSVLIIAFQAFGINRIGFIIIGVVALIVADFAIFQQRYLKANL